MPNALTVAIASASNVELPNGDCFCIMLIATVKTEESCNGETTGTLEMAGPSGIQFGTLNRRIQQDLP